MIGGVKMTLLQTSAAVNPGNSGGGLFNMAGELVGIVNAKKSAEGIEGLGFAIPIDIVYDKLVEIIENGYIHGRASLGIETEYVSDIWEARSKYSLNATGVFVTSSSNDVIKAKDLLYSINGQRVSDGSTYAAIISSLKIGDKVEVILYREGKAKTVEVTVVEYVPSGIFG
jgi:serine protease Do